MVMITIVGSTDVQFILSCIVNIMEVCDLQKWHCGYIQYDDFLIVIHGSQHPSSTFTYVKGSMPYIEPHQIKHVEPHHTSSPA